MDRLTLRMDADIKARLNQIALRRGLTLSEAVRELINREVGVDPLVTQVEELKKLLVPLAAIDVPQLVYHICRASIAPVAAVQVQDKETGDRLNEQVKAAAEIIAARVTGGR